MNTYNQNILHQLYYTAYCVVFSRYSVIGYTHTWREASKICKRYPNDLQWDYVTDLTELHGLTLLRDKEFVFSG